MTLIIILTIVCVILVAIIIKQKEQETNVENEIEDYISEEEELAIDEEEMEDIEPPSDEYIFNENVDKIDILLKTYGLTDNGLMLLYTEEDDLFKASLQLYNSQSTAEELFKESNQTTIINGTEYKLYSTAIYYKDYKEELLNQVSEELFEKYFTIFAKDINGELYIVNTNQDKEVEKFEITETEKKDDIHYQVKYTYTDSQITEERVTTVTFGQNNYGLTIIENIEM